MPDPRPSRHVGEVVLGRYLVDAHIGEGAFAWVYRARTRGGEEVAVKVLHADSAGAVMRFAREVSVLKALPPSPYVVRYLDHGRTRDGHPLLVLEYVDGITLRRGMEHLPAQEPRRCVSFLAVLCRAFADLHHLGVAHRDVKPDNILLPRRGGIKLIDFGVIRDAQGILKLLEDEEDEGARPHVFRDEIDLGVLAGSMPYMSPEAFADFIDRSDVRVDTQSDVYALGVILYQLLTGESPLPRRPPRPDSSLEELERFAAWRLELGDGWIPTMPGIDDALQSIVRRALRADPKKRQPDARVLMKELGEYLRSGAGAPSLDMAMTVETDLAGGALPGVDHAETETDLSPAAKAAALEGGETERTPTRSLAGAAPTQKRSSTAFFFDFEQDDATAVGSGDGGAVSGKTPIDEAETQALPARKRHRRGSPSRRRTDEATVPAAAPRSDPEDEETSTWKPTKGK